MSQKQKILDRCNEIIRRADAMLNSSPALAEAQFGESTPRMIERMWYEATMIKEDLEALYAQIGQFLPGSN